MTDLSKPARGNAGKLSLGNLIVLAAETAASLGACAALHAWMVG